MISAISKGATPPSAVLRFTVGQPFQAESGMQFRLEILTCSNFGALLSDVDWLWEHRRPWRRFAIEFGIVRARAVNSECPLP